MYFDGDLITIDSQTVPGLKRYAVSYQKVWKDTTTNMAGDFRGTLLGTNAILKLEFGGDLREDDISDLIQLLDQDSFEVTYFDPKTRVTKTADYFCDGFDIELLYKQIGFYDTIPVDLHPVARSS